MQKNPIEAVSVPPTSQIPSNGCYIELTIYPHPVFQNIYFTLTSERGVVVDAVKLKNIRVDNSIISFIPPGGRKDGNNKQGPGIKFTTLVAGSQYQLVEVGESPLAWMGESRIFACQLLS